MKKTITTDTYELNGLKFIKYGKIVSVNGSAKLSTDGKTVGVIQNADFMPIGQVAFVSYIYDGSSYVVCVFRILENGNVIISDFFNDAISGINPSYLQLKNFCYMTK